MSGRGIVRKEEGIHQTRNTTCDKQMNVENRQSKVPYLTFTPPASVSLFNPLYKKIVLVTLSSHLQNTLYSI